MSEENRESLEPVNALGEVSDHSSDDDIEFEGEEEDESESEIDIESDTETETESEDGQEYLGDEEVQIDFEGRNPVESDTNDICYLLSRLFLNAPIDCLGLAKLIVAQGNVGSVITQTINHIDSDQEYYDEDTDGVYDDVVCGVNSILNMQDLIGVQGIQDVMQFVNMRARMHASSDVADTFEEILEDGQKDPIGFIINERFINIPEQIAVPTFEYLHKEMLAANSQDMSFDFKHILMIIKLFRTKEGAPGDEIYCNDEDALFVPKAIASFDFDVSEEIGAEPSSDVSIKLNGKELLPYRKVILINGEDLAEVVKAIPDFINN